MSVAVVPMSTDGPSLADHHGTAVTVGFIEAAPSFHDPYKPGAGSSVAIYRSFCQKRGTSWCPSASRYVAARYGPTLAPRVFQLNCEPAPPMVPLMTS